MKPKLLSLLLGLISTILGVRLPAASVVEFAVTNLTVTEYDASNYGRHEVLLTLTPPMNRLVEVTVAPVGGSAVAGPVGCTDCDYYFLDGGATTLVKFQPGGPGRVIIFDTRDDGLPEGNETIVLGLRDPSPGVVLGSRSNLVITLQSSGPWVGVNDGSGDENDGNELIFIRRGDTNVQVTVHYAVGGGTATPGVDFKPALDGTVTFAPGEGERRVGFDTRDGIVDAAWREWFTVRLADPPPGVELINREAVIEISDVQLPTTLDLSYVPPLQGEVFGVAARADGKLAVIHWIPESSELVLLNPDGSLDKKLAVAPPNPRTLAWQADGKLLVSGWDTQTQNLVFQRFWANGSSELPFSGPVNLTFDWFSTWVVAGDGAIYVFDQVGNELWRLKPDGTEDTGFNRPFINSPVAMTVDVEGRLLIAGSLGTADGTSRDGLNRLMLDGASIDAGFQPTFEPDGGDIQRLIVQPNGKILVAGYFTAVNGTPHAGLARLNADGSTDDSFHYSAAPIDYYGIVGLTRQPDGSWFVAYRYGDLQRLGPDGELLHATQVRVVPGEHRPGVSFALPLADGKALLAGGLLDLVNGFAWHRELARVLLEGAPRTGLAFPFSHWGDRENHGNIGGTVTRLGDVTAAAQVKLTIHDRTARAGEDYRLPTTTFEFAPFEQEKEVQIELLDDHTLEGDETFELVLSDATGAELLGPPVEVIILDDEVGFLPGAVTHRADGAVELVFKSVCCPAYVVEVSPDLIHWAPAQRPVEELGNNRYRMVEEPANNAPARFFRLRSPAQVARARVRPAC